MFFIGESEKVFPKQFSETYISYTFQSRACYRLHNV